MRAAYRGSASAPTASAVRASRTADFFEVVDAERTLLDAEDRLAQGRTDAVTALVVLYKALGGAWTEVGAKAR